MSFQEDEDEAIDTTEKEEDWIEYIKRLTKEAEEHMKKMKIPCWNETHRRLKWRMARRIVSLPEERWTKKIFDWHPGRDDTIKTRSLVGRPKRRWEDDINEFFKPDETNGKEKYGLTNNNSWMTEAKKYEEWKKKEEKYIKHGSVFLDRRAKPESRNVLPPPISLSVYVQRPAMAGPGDSSLHDVDVLNFVDQFMPQQPILNDLMYKLTSDIGRVNKYVFEQENVNEKMLLKTRERLDQTSRSMRHLRKRSLKMYVKNRLDAYNGVMSRRTGSPVRTSRCRRMTTSRAPTGFRTGATYCQPDDAGDAHHSSR